MSFVCTCTVPYLFAVCFHMAGAGRILWRAWLQQMALEFLKYTKKDGCVVQHTSKVFVLFF